MNRKQKLSTLLILILCLGSFSCQEMTPKEFFMEIEIKCQGLTYISEEDAEVHAYMIDQAVHELTPLTFLQAGGFPPFTPIEEVADPDAWFQVSINRDSRWQALKDFLDSNMDDVKVFKIGLIRRKIYAVGIYQNRIVGIQTLAVET